MITRMKRKRPGPKPTGKGTLIGVRLQPDMLSRLDKHIEKDRPGMTRPEAIRIIIDSFLFVRVHDDGTHPEDLNASNDD